MDCTLIKLYLEAYEKGHLEDQHKEAIKKHLALCEDCRQELEEIRMVNALFYEIKIPSLPKNFTNTVMHQIKDQKKNMHTSIWKDVRKWGLSFVATGLIMLVVNFTSVGVNIATLTANINKHPINFEEIYDYTPSAIMSKGLGQIENFVETIENRR